MCNVYYNTRMWRHSVRFAKETKAFESIIYLLSMSNVNKYCRTNYQAFMTRHLFSFSNLFFLQTICLTLYRVIHTHVHKKQFPPIRYVFCRGGRQRARVTGTKSFRSVNISYVSIFFPVHSESPYMHRATTW